MPGKLKLKSVKIQNWMSINDQFVEFPDRGLVAVMGHNQVSNAVGSIGSGKTALGEAIVRTLTGSVGRFVNTGHYCPSDGGLYVKVNTELGTSPFTVEIGYKHAPINPRGEGVRFTLDGRLSSRPSPDQTHSHIMDILDIDPEIVRWSIFVDGDAIRFSDLSQTKAVELIMAVLGQRNWSKHHASAKATADSTARQVSELASKIDMTHSLIASELAAVENLEYRLEASRTTLEAKKAAMVSQALHVKDEMANISGMIAEDEAKLAKLEADRAARIAAIANQVHEFELEEIRLRDKMAVVQANMARKTVSMTSISSTIRAYREEQRRIEAEPSKCPMCQRPMDESHTSHVATRLKQVIEAVEQCNLELEKLKQELQPIKDEETELKAEVSVVTKRRSDLTAMNTNQVNSDIRHLNESIRANVNCLGTKKQQLAILERGPSDSEVVGLEASIQSKRESINDLDVKETSMTLELDEAKQVESVARYWVTGFSPAGIPNLILRRSIGPLNTTSSALSRILTGGLVDIKYSTERSLASGETRNKLDILVQSGSRTHRPTGPSKGEAGLTNLIVAETLSSLGQMASRIGFRWYDEVINKQDSRVRNNVLSYLRDMANSMDLLIFVVDHHPETPSFGDYVLTAVKDQEGVTTFKWS